VGSHSPSSHWIFEAADVSIESLGAITHCSSRSILTFCRFMSRKHVSSPITQIDGAPQHFLPGMESILMNLSSRRQKGFFGKLPAPRPITIDADTAPCVARMKTPAPSHYPLWRQVVGPCILTLSGLVIAFALWGLATKPSPYHGHAVPSSRVPVARLWIEPRGASSPATSRLRAKSHLTLDSPAILVPISQPTRLDRAAAYIAPILRRGIAYFDFLIPFRSPPQQRFCLA